MSDSQSDILDGASVVFDLDGTLVDTAPDIFRATNRILAANGYAPGDPAKMRELISHGARKIVFHTLAEQGVEPDDAEIDRLEAELLADYTDNIAVDSVPYADVVTVLQDLRARGAVLSICTNKKHALAESLLTALDLTELFAAVRGRDSFAVQKPHPDHLLFTIDAAGGSRQRAIMIGDSEVDVATARAAGLPVVVMTYGYAKVAPEALGADATLADFALLPGAIIASLAAGRSR